MNALRSRPAVDARALLLLVALTLAACAAPLGSSPGPGDPAAPSPANPVTPTALPSPAPEAPVDCPAPSFTAAQLATLDPAELVRCYPGRDIEVTGELVACGVVDPVSILPDLFSTECRLAASGSQAFVVYDSAAGKLSEIGSGPVRVSGHVADPGALACRWALADVPGPSPDDLARHCREAFIVTAATTLS